MKQNNQTVNCLSCFNDIHETCGNQIEDEELRLNCTCWCVTLRRER